MAKLETLTATRLSGGDRNDPCLCGCGKKRKKCPNGAPNIIPPAHNLTLEEYAAKVREALAVSVPPEIVETLYGTYYDSHIVSYWRDEMITPERCVDLIMEMHVFDTEKSYG